jgi:hypothetical protein
MTGKRVSAQQILLIAAFVAEPESWFSARTIEHNTGLKWNTIRPHCVQFFKLKLLDRVAIFPECRYRLASNAQEQPYFARMLEAAAAIGPLTRPRGSGADAAPTPEFAQILEAAAAMRHSLGFAQAFENTP